MQKIVDLLYFVVTLSYGNVHQRSERNGEREREKNKHEENKNAIKLYS